jgi:hypothetical protein
MSLFDRIFNRLGRKKENELPEIKASSLVKVEKEFDTFFEEDSSLVAHRTEKRTGKKPLGLEVVINRSIVIKNSLATKFALEEITSVPLTMKVCDQTGEIVAVEYGRRPDSTIKNVFSIQVECTYQYINIPKLERIAVREFSVDEQYVGQFFPPSSDENSPEYWARSRFIGIIFNLNESARTQLEHIRARHPHSLLPRRKR